MRPHDIVVLLKIVTMKGNWMNKDLAAGLLISGSEISESLNRSKIVKLLSPDKKRVLKGALLRFIQHGLNFVFPAEPGALVRGLPTAHSGPLLKEYFASQDAYVWPDPTGKAKGQSISPLYPNQIQAAKIDQELYELLTLIDAVRVGRVRESEKAIELLKLKFEDNAA